MTYCGLRGHAMLGSTAMMILIALGTLFIISPLAVARDDNPKPPARPVKLIFIHHSCGENWLADEQGGLGKALAANNYFISDTNYGWGPNCIGDRTDIINWPEWFTGPESDRYLKALYTGSGAHPSYARNMTDPGGVNQIIMFKSCFPNSNLEGNPNDKPARGEGLTVSNAKAIYIDLLAYFATRPDKLFIVVTAPPVQDPAHAANARAFNTWLVRDWLASYKDNNVAVFDFYNVLTGTENHHRFHNGTIEYAINRGGNTLHYPTDGDDHPNPAGNRKATEEFVPLLNVYYNRWQKGVPAAPPPAVQPKPAPSPITPKPQPLAKPAVKGTTLEPKHPTPPAPTSGMIDDFEADKSKWVVFKDHEKDTSLAFSQDKGVSYSGTAGMRIEYDIAPDSWATCSLVSPSPHDWRDGRGLAVYLRAERAGQPVTIIVYQGNSPDNLAHFEFHTQTNQEAVSGWQRVDIPWDKFVQPSWEGDGSARFDPAQARGLAFAFNADPGSRTSGRFWVDDISFLSALPPP